LLAQAEEYPQARADYFAFASTTGLKASAFLPARSLLKKGAGTFAKELSDESAFGS
jgi:hypothetical protein